MIENIYRDNFQGWTKIAKNDHVMIRNDVSFDIQHFEGYQFTMD